jgi:hypothetical protein
MRAAVNAYVCIWVASSVQYTQPYFVVLACGSAGKMRTQPPRLGWGRSEIDVGIEDWGFQHPFQALICETP